LRVSTALPSWIDPTSVDSESEPRRQLDAVSASPLHARQTGALVAPRSRSRLAPAVLRIALAAAAVTAVMCGALLLRHHFHASDREPAKSESGPARPREEAALATSPSSVDHPSIEPAF